MKTTLFTTFFAVCALLLSGCGGGGRIVTGPNGEIFYQLPPSSSTEDHCATAGRFSKKVANSRSHPEIRDGKTFIVFHDPKSSRADFEEDMKDIERFTPVGKRNYEKIQELLFRILDTDEFKKETPEQVDTAIYQECMLKMTNKTWFPNQATSNNQ